MRHCWKPWALVLSLLLAVFYALDRINFLRAPRGMREKETAGADTWKFDGLPNLLFLAAILGAVFLPAGFREVAMILSAAASYKFTPGRVHRANDFSFGPIKEIAWLFLGIFATMTPVLDYLEMHSRSLGIDTELHYFWGAGIFSGVLDSAPAYITFAAAALGRFGLHLDNPADMRNFLAAHAGYLAAISTGTVFLGSLTYLGNGPNLMVKAIAEHSRVQTPDFFYYVLRFSLPILLPIFALAGWIFFKTAP